jgi:hypothetical protein
LDEVATHSEVDTVIFSFVGKDAHHKAAISDNFAFWYCLAWVEENFVGSVNTSGKAGAQILHLPLGDDSSPRGR